MRRTVYGKRRTAKKLSTGYTQVWISYPQAQVIHRWLWISARASLASSLYTVGVYTVADSAQYATLGYLREDGGQAIALTLDHIRDVH